MKKLIALSVLILINASLYSQEKVLLSHLFNMSDVLEVSVEIENKPNDNFHLIKIDTMMVTDHKGQMITNNFIENTFTKANVLARYKIDEKKKYKNFTVKGALKYFKPSAGNGSYFNLGKFKKLKRNINLIDKSITEKNPDIFFSIVDSTTISKIFPDFKYKIRNIDDYKKIDFGYYDVMYAYKDNKKQNFTVVMNEEIEPGYDVLTLTDKNTKIQYKLIKLRREMTSTEKEDITFELMIENENSVKLIPFEFKNVEAKNL